MALWAIMAAFLWRFAGFTMVVYLAAIQALPREYDEYAVLEGASRFQQLRRVTWPLLWPQTFALVLLTTLGTPAHLRHGLGHDRGRSRRTPPRRSPRTST